MSCLNCQNAEAVKYCNQACRHEHYRNEMVQKWLNGEHNGVKGKTQTCGWIKRHLIKERGEKCEYCGWAERNPFRGNIPIELSHKDGNFLNNHIDNLELICPNCHSLTESYKGANKKAGRPRSKYYRGL